MILFNKYNRERTEIIYTILFTFVTHKWQEHLHFPNIFSYFFHSYDITCLENIHPITF